jgi:hypothetical protein
MSFPVRRVALAMLVSLPIPFPASPVGAQEEVTILEDGDFLSWELVPPVPDGASLRVSDDINPRLTVRHDHGDRFYSRIESRQRSPLAIYDPGASGPLDSIVVQAALWIRFTGGPSHAYSSRTVTVRPVVLQSGTTYVAAEPMLSWISSSNGSPYPNGQVVSSGNLGALHFRDALGNVASPDFSATGLPFTVALDIVSHLQAGAPADLQRYELDLDAVRIAAVPAPASGLPTLRFTEAPSQVVVNGVTWAVFGQEIDDWEVQVRLPVTLSRLDHEPVTFRLRNPRLGWSSIHRIPDGVGSIDLFVSAYGPHDEFEIVELSGAELGVPSRAQFFGSPTEVFHDGVFESRCVADYLDTIFYLLGQRYGSPPPTPKELPRPAGSEDEPAFLGTLRAFRDQVMVTSAAGRRYAELYRTYSPELQRVFARRPGVIFDLWGSHGAWLDGLAALVRGEGGSTVVSPDMASDLNRLLDRFADDGGGALARAIAVERARLGLDQIVGLSMSAFWQRVVERGEGDACEPLPERLCLAGGRYAVEADFKTFEGVAGRARAVLLSGDSGYFWFFDEANVELLAKVIEGCGVNDRYWSYNAGLTNLAVELFVHDPTSGRGKVYRSDSGETFAPILDSDFVSCDGSAAGASSDPPPRSEVVPEELVGSACAPSDTALCLLDGRFRATATFRTAAGATGAAHAVPLTADTGTFWFFSPGNVELLVKAIDACGLAGFENFWIFAAGTTDVEVELRVEDTVAGGEETYRRPLGTPFAPVLDSAAFPTCP